MSSRAKEQPDLRHDTLESRLQNRIERRSLGRDSEQEGASQPSASDHEDAQLQGGTLPNRESGQSRPIAIQPPSRLRQQRASSSFPFAVPRARVLSPTLFDELSSENTDPQHTVLDESGLDRNSPSKVSNALDDVVPNRTPITADLARHRPDGHMYATNTRSQNRMADQAGTSSLFFLGAIGKTSKERQNRSRRAQTTRRSRFDHKRPGGVEHQSSLSTHDQMHMSRSRGERRAENADPENPEVTRHTPLESKYAIHVPGSPPGSPKSTGSFNERTESFETAHLKWWHPNTESHGDTSPQPAKPPRYRRLLHEDPLTRLVSKSRFEGSYQTRSNLGHEVPEIKITGNSRLRHIDQLRTLYEHGDHNSINDAHMTKDHPLFSKDWSVETLKSSKSGETWSAKSPPLTISSRFSRSVSLPTLSTLSDVRPPRRGLGSVPLPRRDGPLRPLHAGIWSSTALLHEPQQRASGSRASRQPLSQTARNILRGTSDTNAGAQRPPRFREARPAPAPPDPLTSFAGGSRAPFVPFNIRLTDELAEERRREANPKKHWSGWDTP